jgi:hypothetical protein
MLSGAVLEDTSAQSTLTQRLLMAGRAELLSGFAQSRTLQLQFLCFLPSLRARLALWSDAFPSSLISSPLSPSSQQNSSTVDPILCLLLRQTRGM